MSAWPPEPPRRDDLSGHDLDAYDAVAERQRRLWGMEPTGYFGALLNSPRVAAAVSELGRRVRSLGADGDVPDDVRETADLVLAVELHDDLVFSAHLPDALAVGVRSEFVVALLDGTPERFTDDEHQLVDHIVDVLHGQVTADGFDRLVQRLGVRGAVGFTALITFLISTIRCMQALGATHQAGPIDKRALLQGFLDGTSPLPDPAARRG